MGKGFFIRLAVSNIRKHRKVYYPYALTSVLTVMMLYIIRSLANNPELRSESLQFTLGLGTWVTCLFTVIFLFYTNSFLMKRRKMEFGLLNILGMEKKHISRVVCYETLVILAASLALGLGLGLLADKLMYMVLMRILGGKLGGLTFYVSVPSLLFAAGVVSLTYLLILLNSIRQIHLSKPIELLRGGQVGEKEPKAKWVLAVLGLLMLGGGYYISIKVTNVVASIFAFFVAVVLVILGTYLLYTAGSVALLKTLRKRKGYYYKAKHFINVSGMIYRMKQNAVGLANISILCTMVLVIVFGVFSLWFGMADIVQKRCPYTVCISAKEAGQRAQVKTLVDAALEHEETKREIDYTCFSFAGYKQGDAYIVDMSEVGEMNAMLGDGLTNLFVMTLEDYNRNLGLAETLEPDEILLGSRDNKHTEDTLTVFGDTYRVKGRYNPDVLQNDLANANAYAVRWMVVADQATMDRLFGQQADVYGKYAAESIYYLGVDLVSPREEDALRVSDAISAAFRADHIAYDYVDTYPEIAAQLRELLGALLFVGLFLGSLFIMAMILIVYYKQISEGYDDKERYAIMRKVGLSRAEIKSCIRNQTLTVFFLPLVTAGVHTAFSFPSITHMFAALAMTNIPLMAWCLLGSFLAFAVLYWVVYKLTARVYYRIVS